VTLTFNGWDGHVAGIPTWVPVVLIVLAVAGGVLSMPRWLVAMSGSAALLLAGTGIAVLSASSKVTVGPGAWLTLAAAGCVLALSLRRAPEPALAA
jgi:hypothetical protein